MTDASDDIAGRMPARSNVSVSSLAPEMTTSNTALQIMDTDRPNVSAGRAGLLVLNADDWGRDCETTQRILECVLCGTVSSASAMVFMDDSERAADLARGSGLDAGLHLNFTMPFSAPQCPGELAERQRKLSAYLLRHPLALVVFHPGLAKSFEYVVKAQLDEFCRLYGKPPDRIDGHHHMHLSANVLLGKLLPNGTLVRRNFTFRPGEKSLANRLYRQAIDRKLAKHHRVVDYLFSLPPLEPPSRLERIRSLALQSVVEVETHPVNADEFLFLTDGRAARWSEEVPIARSFTVPGSNSKLASGEGR